MKTSANPHIGSDFEDFLAEENMLDTATAIAVKHATAWQIQTERNHSISPKLSMEKRMNTAVHRWIDYWMRTT